MAFYAGLVDEAWVGDDFATPQPGRFYGGWVTSRIVGPFKGGPDRPAGEGERVKYDFVIIGAGPAGEAAAFKARRRGPSVAVVERDLFGGSCPHWGCIPSKSLLNGGHAPRPGRPITRGRGPPTGAIT